MRKIMRRVMSFLLALVLVISLLPNTAILADAIGLGVMRSVGGVKATVSNALEGCELEIVDTWEASRSDFSTLNEVDLSVYGSFDDAVTETRKQMAARNETIVVYFQSTDANPENRMQAYVDAMFIHTGEAKEGDYLRWQYATWGLDVSGMTDGLGNYYYTFTASLVYYTTAEEEALVDTAVAQLLQELNVGLESDYVKVKAVYDWLCANVTYDFDNLEDESYKRKFTAYAALIDRTSVCQGYAVLFYRLMLELGVDARLIAGIGNGGPHSWNIVELDELYYNLDATWDAGRTEYDYFLRANANFGDHARYDEYADANFNAIYPMSAEDYTPGEETVCAHESYQNVYGYEPTCTQEGMLEYWQCTDCGLYFLDADRTVEVEYRYLYLDPLGHDYVDGTCSRCGEADPDALPANACGDNLTWTFDEETGTLTISGTGEMWDFTSALGEDIPDTGSFLPMSTSMGTPAPWAGMEMRRMIRKVVIGSGVTYIGSYAFEDCCELVEVDFAENCEVIGIGENAFYSCGNLTEIAIPDGVTHIAYGAFMSCGLTGELVIPASVTVIESYAFYDADITSISFVDGCQLTTIGTKAFAYCSNLTAVTVPASVTALEQSAFSDCGALANIYVEAGNTAYAALDGVLYSADMQTLILYPLGKTDTAFAVPDGVVTIGKNAFYSACYLLQVTLPETVTTIGDYAFATSYWLESINIPESVTSIGRNAFAACIALTQIYIPANVTSVGTNALGNCSSLDSIYLCSASIVATLTANTGCGSALANATKLYILSSITEVPEYVLTLYPDVSTVEVDGVSYTLYSHTHSFDTLVRERAATCTKNGYEVYSCACGREQSTTIPATGHNYEGSNTWNSVDPTCMRGGVLEIEIYCTACDTPMGGNARPIEALGHDFVDGICSRCGEEKTLSGTCGDDLTWSFDENSGRLTVDGTGAMYDYTYYNITEGAVYPPWYTYAEAITSVVIGENVETIGKDAFYFCQNMTDVYVLSEDIAAGMTSVADCVSLLDYAQRIYIWVGLTVTDFVSTTYPYKSMAQLDGYNMECYSKEEIENTCEHLGMQVFVQEPTCTEQGYTGSWCPDCMYHEEYNFVPALGHDFVDGICSVCGEKYVPTGICGNDLIWTFDEETGVLAITGTGVMYDYGVNGIGSPAPWHEYREQILELQIADTVTGIGFEAFADCTALTSFVVPLGVEYLGWRAFAGCTGLQEVVVPEACAWTSTYQYAFEGCVSLTDIYIFSETVVAKNVGWLDYTHLLDYAKRIYICQAEEVSDAIDVIFTCTNQPEMVELDGVTRLLYTRGTHHYVRTSAYAATCTEDGYNEYTCAACGYTYKAITEATAGHSWDADYICTTCGEKPDYLYESVVTLEDLVLTDGVYYTADGRPAVIAVGAPLAKWLSGASLNMYVQAYGDQAFSMTYWEQLETAMNADGFVPLTEETLVWFLDLITGNPTWGENETCLTYYLGFRIIREDAPEIEEHTHVWDEDGACEICCEIRTEYNTEEEVVVENLVVDQDSSYTTETGDDVYIDMNQLAQQFGTSTLTTFAKIGFDHKTGFFAMESEVDYWQLLLSKMNADGYTPLTQQTLAWLEAFIAQQSGEGEQPQAEEYLVTKPVPTYDHSYTAVVTKPTCTEMGYTTYTCTCGDSYTADYVDARGHLDENRDHICDGYCDETCGPDCGHVCGIRLSECVDADADGLCDWCGQTSVKAGDVDGDGDVDSDDAIYLLYATFNETEYPLNQSGDFDGDGDVDSDDAIYLLYFTFNPEEYPLH